MSTIAERVAIGVAWLDEHEPGWVSRIDLDTLEMGDCGQCICGQLVGNFQAALKRWGHNPFAVTTSDWVEAHGFDVSYGGYPSLNTAWRRVITERRAGQGEEK